MKSNFTYDLPISPMDLTHVTDLDEDKRVIVNESSCGTIPFSAIGLLKCYYEHCFSYRTGFLVGEDIVLTAGHNLDDPSIPEGAIKPIGKALKIEFFPGLFGNHSQFEKCTSIEIVCSDNIKKNDYGIIKLDKKIGKLTGYFEIKEVNQKVFNEINEVIVSGYPVNKVEIKNNLLYYQFYSKGFLIDINQKKGYLISSSQSSYGQSGGCLFYYDKQEEKYYAIGIHVATNPTLKVYISTLITKDIINKLKLFN